MSGNYPRINHGEDGAKNDATAYPPVATGTGGDAPASAPVMAAPVKSAAPLKSSAPPPYGQQPGYGRQPSGKFSPEKMASASKTVPVLPTTTKMEPLLLAFC